MIPAVPTESFYEKPRSDTLFQGDILRLPENSPYRIADIDLCLIISKSCDLVIADDITRHEVISLLTLLSFNNIKKILAKNTLDRFASSRWKIVALKLIALCRSSIKANQIDNLIKNNMSRFMYLPPDGKELKEPFIVDFDLSFQFDGSDPKVVQHVLDSKILQLASPFRERVAQRFALHFSTIGINDNTIRDKSYIKALKELF